MNRVFSNLKKGLFFSLAGVFFVLGVAGLFLPGLPGTPFFLLTSYFLVRCSPKLNEALLRSKTIGPLLRDWQERRGVKRSVKKRAIAIVTIAVTLSLWFTQFPIAAKFGIGLMAFIGILVILRLPTVD